MSTRSSLYNAISAVALTAALGACAAPRSNRATTASDYRVKSVNLGYATRAVAALNSKDYAQAISFAEAAAAQTPRDGGFRALLGNAYFGAGRFASAEQAFRDSLALYPDQGKVMLKLALVEIALGKPGDALELIDYARPLLDAADYGLALALAGRPDSAINVLRQAAGSPASDARVRQNLALAYAMSGDWVNARVVAAQDVPANELDARIQQWMEFAGNSSHPESRIAAVVGVTPSAADPGQPVKLALVAPNAQAAAVAAAAVAPAAPVQQLAAPQTAPRPSVVAAYAPPPPPPPRAVAKKPVVVTASAEAEMRPQARSLTVKLPEAKPVTESAPAFAPEVAAYIPPPPLPPEQFPYVEVKKFVAKVRKASLAANLAEPAKRPSLRKASAVQSRASIRTAALRTNKSNVVLQLGAYGSERQVMTAWNRKAQKFAALANYAPVSAFYSGAKGKFYRLSVRGFTSASEASRLCLSIKRSGGACFVRSVAGDRPVEIASR